MTAMTTTPLTDIVQTLEMPHGLEIDLEGLGGAPGGFTLTYTVGANRYAVLGCKFAPLAFI